MHAVDGITYEVHSGRTLGIVGESGSGKTVSSLTTLGLTRRQGARISGRILFEGQDLVTLPEDELRAIRGNDIAMIFQDPLSSLHPAVQGRSPADRGGARPPRRLQGAGARARDRAARPRRNPRSRQARRRVPARVLGGHAPARDDRDGARQRAEAADRRRADDRAGRDRAGADPRADGTPAARAGDGDRDHHPRPRRRRRDGRRHRGHVRGTDRRDGLRGAHVRGPRAPVHVGPAEVDPHARTARARRISCRSPAPRRASSARPSGCHFHPRCPYAQPDHARIDPQLQPVPDEPGHHVACLLESDVRRRLWQQLGAGRTPEEALAEVGLPGERRHERRHRLRRECWWAARARARPGQALPDHPRDHLPAQDRRRQGGRRRELGDRARGDAGDRRRDRLRQEHDCQAADAPARRDRRRDRLRGRRTSRA